MDSTTTTGDSGGSSSSRSDDDDDTAVHETHRDDHSRINRHDNNHHLLHRNDGHGRNALPPPSYSMGRPTHSFHSMVTALLFVRTTTLDHPTKNHPHSSPKSFDSNHTRRPRHCRTTLDAKASTHRYSSRRTVVSHPQKRRYLHVMESTMTILHYYCCCRLPFIVMILPLLLFQQQQHPYHSPSCFCSSFIIITTTTTIPTRRRTQQPQQCHPWQQQYSSSSVSSFQRPTRRRHCDIWKIRATPNDEEEKEQDAASPLFSTEYIYTQRLQHQIDQLHQKDRSSTPIAVAVCFAC